ncbi:MAG: hypothetical protein KGI38_01110 [Thaumarchaeota archaeon]|nr:hypothetical protein [Nitrososphaerota archaeon]
MIRSGASSAIGIDLSPTMVRLAQSLSAEGGLSGRASFELGDGATAKLKKSDVVVLDAVLCCYPDFTSFVDNSASAAGRYYVFAVPDDARLLTRFMRLILPLQAVVFRRGSFRFFIHPTARIRSRLEGKGFRLVSKSSAGWIWSVFVFGATGAA